MPDPMDATVYSLTPYVPCRIGRQGDDVSPIKFNFMIDAEFAVQGTYSGTIYLELFYE